MRDLTKKLRIKKKYLPNDLEDDKKLTRGLRLLSIAEIRMALKIE